MRTLLLTSDFHLSLLIHCESLLGQSKHTKLIEARFTASEHLIT